MAWGEIAKNGLVPALANSFLVFAEKGAPSVAEDWLGIAFSHPRRKKEFATTTRFVKQSDGVVRVLKSRNAGGATHDDGELEHREWEGDWIDRPSLQLVSLRRARVRGLNLEQILEPSRNWYEELRRSSWEEGGASWVSGERIDAIWRNCFVDADRCEFIDQEWIWKARLPLSLVVSRALYYFARNLLGSSGLSPSLRGMRIRRFITEAARSYGIELTRDDFNALARFETAFLDRTSLSTIKRGIGKLDVLLTLRHKLDPARPRRFRRLARGGLRRLKRIVLSARN